MCVFFFAEFRQFFFANPLQLVGPPCTDNGIGPDGAAALAKALRENTVLQRLNMEGLTVAETLWKE